MRLADDIDLGTVMNAPILITTIHMRVIDTYTNTVEEKIPLAERIKILRLAEPLLAKSSVVTSKETGVGIIRDLELKLLAEKANPVQPVTPKQETPKQVTQIAPIAAPKAAASVSSTPQVATVKAGRGPRLDFSFFCVELRMKDGTVKKDIAREQNETVLREALEEEIEEGLYEYDECEEAAHAKDVLARLNNDPDNKAGFDVRSLAEQFADNPAEIISIQEISFEE